jgi:hypothetical protein
MNTSLFAPLPIPPGYLDPGSGSYLIQLLIAALVGIGFAIKLYWRRITAAFRSLMARPRNDEPKE